MVEEKEIKRESRISVKKKRWYNIIAPKVLNNVIVGETLASEPELLKGRGVKINLYMATKNIKKQHIEVRFKIVELRGSDCITDFVGYEISQGHVRRLVKRAKCRVDDSFIADTKDGKKIRIKSLVLTRDKAQHSILTALRKATKEYLIKKANELEYNAFLNTTIIGDIQKDLKNELRKIYPLSVAEIRAIVLI